MIDAATIAAVLITAIILATLTLTFGRMAWNAFWTHISRHIATHIDNALGPEKPTRYRDLDDEYRALVLAEHNKDDQ